MFALIEYLLTITFLISIQILSLLLTPLAIFCTTIGIFGDWPHRISFLKNRGTRRHTLSNTSTTATGTTSTSISDHSTRSLSNDLDSTPRTSRAAQVSSGPAPAPAPAWSTPARVRGTAFALALLRLWYAGESRALSQFMFTVNSFVLVGYGGLWLWKRHQQYGHFMLGTRTEHGWVFRWRRAVV